MTYELDSIDYWRLCEDLSVVQSALLVVGVDPSGAGYDAEYKNINNRPRGYEAVKTAIINAIKSKEIEGCLVKSISFDGDGLPVPNSEYINLEESNVKVSSLRAYLEKKGFESGFFFAKTKDLRSYLDEENPCYAPKLAAIVKAWEEVTASPVLLNGKTPKQALEKWLREHASEYGLTDNEGNPQNNTIKDMSKVANWRPEGGAAKTPTHTLVVENLLHPKNRKEEQGVDVGLDDEVPF